MVEAWWERAGACDGGAGVEEVVGGAGEVGEGGNGEGKVQGYRTDRLAALWKELRVVVGVIGVEGEAVLKGGTDGKLVCARQDREGRKGGLVVGVNEGVRSSA